MTITIRKSAHGYRATVIVGSLFSRKKYPFPVHPSPLSAINAIAGWAAVCPEVINHQSKPLFSRISGGFKMFNTIIAAAACSLLQTFGAIIIILAACAMLQSCGTAPVDTVQPSLNTLSDTDTVFQSLITGSFSECEKTNGDLVIPIGSGVAFGLVQIHNHPSMPWFDTWEFETGILFQWDYDNGELRVSDPNNFLTNGSYLYRIQLFR